MTPRKTVFPEGHWSLQVEIPYSMGVACGELIFLCGQTDLEGDGNVCHKGDLLAQSKRSIEHICNLFEALDASPEDIVKLVVFYVPDSDISEANYLQFLARNLPTQNRPVITLVPVSGMFYADLCVEIDAYGYRDRGGLRREVAGQSGFADLVRVGEMIFGGGVSAVDDQGGVAAPADAVAQTRLVLERIAALLDVVDAGVSDLVKINNWYVAGGSAEEWLQTARIRADFYPEPGPCATGIPLHDLNLQGAQIRTDFWAMRAVDGQVLEKTHHWPDGHWDWPIHLPFKHGLQCGNLVFIGGQVSMNAAGEVVRAGQLDRQTRTAMDNVGKVLAGFDLSHANIVKLNTYYRGAGADELHRNVQIRGSYFDRPGPASTGIPFRDLAYAGMEIEIEAIAMI